MVTHHNLNLSASASPPPFARPASAFASIAAMANYSLDDGLPPLPPYALEPAGDVFSYISDFWLSLLLPVAVYWITSLVFHTIDVLDLFPQYRLHTPDEIARRNRAGRYEVARDVIVQQLIQVVTGAALAMTEPPDLRPVRADYPVAVWAARLRLAQRALPGLLGLLGLNAAAMAKRVAASHPLLAGVLAGGRHPELADSFCPWELAVAGLIYRVAMPGLQFLAAVFILDTWQYFLHRLMHMNRWMYSTFHSRHHRLYVPYAYGALYNHPFEGFLLDTLGAGIAFKLTSMTLRQGTCFFTFSTVKTIDDHCGYAFPWDPLQLITSNNAAYHDIHHQTWGIKANFSQPFFTFWDTLFGTKYKGPRADRLADKKRLQDEAK